MGKKSFIDAVKAEDAVFREIVEQEAGDASQEDKDALVKELERKYQEYVERKKKEIEAAKLKGAKDEDLPRIRDRADWKEASEHWATLKQQGEEFADEKFEEFKQRYPDAQREITIVTSEGTRIRVDAIAVDPKTKEIIIQEYKSSKDAPYTRNQLDGFDELLNGGGGTVVGDGKKEFTDGFEIPKGQRVQVVRPDGTTYFK